MARLRPPSIGVRLALWSTAGLAVVLVVVGVAMAAGLRSGLRERAHDSLEVPFRVVAHELQAHPAERLTDVLGDPPSGERSDELVGQLLDGSGRVVDSTGQPTVARPLVSQRELRAATTDGEWHEARSLPGRPGEDIVVVVPVGDAARRPSWLVLAQTLGGPDEEVRRLVRLFVPVALVLLLTSFVGGWWIVRSALRPVDRLTRQAALIEAERSGEELPVPRREDEISRLAVALNGMLARLRREVDRQRRFSADASHELRTPLALMRSELDVALRSPSTPDPARPVLLSVGEEVDRLGRIVDDLLLLSRADAAGRVELSTTECDLLDLAVTVAARARTTAAGRGITISVAGDPVIARADERLLGQAVANLVDNAVRFTRPGGRVEVEVADDPPGITVVDHGPGIPADELERIFERFHQVDPSRHAGGSGLGLAIVRSIVDAHGGAVAVDSSPGHGARFAITLPRRP